MEDARLGVSLRRGLEEQVLNGVLDVVPHEQARLGGDEFHVRGGKPGNEVPGSGREGELAEVRVQGHERIRSAEAHDRDTRIGHQVTYHR